MGAAGGWQPGWVYYSAGSSPGGNGGGKSKARAPTIQDYCRSHAHTCGNANQPVGGGGNMGARSSGPPPEGLWTLNPFGYDTVSVSGFGIAKLVLGGELTVYASINMRALRELRFGDFDAAFGINLDITAGVSEAAAAGIVLTGSDGSVRAQSGIDVIGLNGLTGNVLGCLPPPHFAGWCLGASPTWDLSSGEITSWSWLGGAGQGVDLSVNLVTFNDYFLYLGRSSFFQWPFSNSNFRP